jgi:histidyl-tRNA synthetase
VHESDIIKERAKHTINLEVLGTDRSIAEALLIKTAVSILKDNGYKDFTIEINSIGDKESISKFSRELTNYYRKNLNTLSAHCRQNFKKDPFYILHCDECDPNGKLKENAPTSLSCLSDISRAHFKEVLEFIETMNIPYKINNNLVPDRKYCSGTIFEIKEVLSNGNNGETLAVGFRYDGIAQKIGHKRDNPGVGIKIFLKKKAVVKKVSKLAKPIAFYIQLGDEAKHKSLELIEALRQEKIFVHHMLGRDKFGSQFSHVEKTKVPYVIIMGKKEFLENSVMVRENSTRTQQSIPTHQLVEHLRKIKK